MHQDLERGGQAGVHAADVHLPDGPDHARDGLLTVSAPDDELAQHRVVLEADLETAVHGRVEPDPRPAGRPEVVEHARRGEEAIEGILGVDPHLDGVPADGEVLLPVAEGLTVRDAQLLPHEVNPRDHLGHGMLDLQAGVHLQEEELAARPEELDRAGPTVVHGVPRTQRDLAHGPPRVLVEDARGGLLHELLVAALDRALALEEVHAVAVAVKHHLDLHVPRGVEVALQVDAAIPEGGHRLPRGRPERRRHLARLAHDADALAAAARGRLDRDGVADGLRLAGRRLHVVHRIDEPGDAGDPGLLHDAAGGDLVPHRGDRARGRTDPRDASLLDPARELGVLAEEPVAGVNGLRSGLARRREDLVHIEIALGGQLPAEGDGDVRHAGVQRPRVRFGIDGDGLEAHLSCGTDHAQRDLSTVGDEDAFEHAFDPAAKGGPQRMAGDCPQPSPLTP